jgi:hypothetical protein
MSKKVILVLGMHRSGTSLLTRILSLLGAKPPLSLLPPTSENPGGYWESEPVMWLNNELLGLTGNTWKSIRHIPDEWFNDVLKSNYRERATNILDREFGTSDLIVLKCPRICRLMPFWETVLQDAGYDVRPVIILRNPEDIFRSLAARATIPRFSPAAIVQPEHSALLWLRYVLDAERYTRNRSRAIIQYTDLLGDWSKVLHTVTAATDLTLPTVSDSVRSHVNSLFEPGMARQRNPDEPQITLERGFFEPFQLFADSLLNGSIGAESIDALTTQFNQVGEAESHHNGTVRTVSDEKMYHGILQQVHSMLNEFHL